MAQQTARRQPPPGIPARPEPKAPEVPTRTATAGIRIVKDTFVYPGEDGWPEVVTKGTSYRASHPFVERFAEFFHPVDYVDVEDD